MNKYLIDPLINLLVGWYVTIVLYFEKDTGAFKGKREETGWDSLFLVSDFSCPSTMPSRPGILDSLPVKPAR